MTASLHDTEHSLPSEPPAGAGFRRLHPLGRVGVRAQACLHLQKPFVGCRRCEDACPQACFTLGAGRLDLDPTRCTACGSCAARCPTAALAVEGCTLALPAPGTAFITVACKRAGALAPEPTCRVPCLRALAVNDYLRLALAADGAPIRVAFDAAACQACTIVGKGGEPHGTVLEAARRALAAAGLPDEALPQALTNPMLPSGNHRASPLPEEPAPGRRAFFAGVSRALSAGLTQAAPALGGEAPAPAARPRVPVPYTRGTETRLLLIELARRHGRDLPAGAQLSQVSASDACRAHGACARACPSGALILHRDEARATLSFDPWQCVDCGACERVCPEHALSHAPAAWREAPGQAQVLASVAQAECVRCGALMAAAADDSALCDRCTKASHLARAGFALFHPAHRESAEPPSSGRPHTEQQRPE